MIHEIWLIMRKSRLTKEEYPFHLYLDKKTAKNALEWIKEKESKLEFFEKENFELVKFNRKY